MSVIRIGDGEGRLIGWPEFTPRPLLNGSLRYWFGRTNYSGAELARLAHELREACRQADVLGLPDEDHARRNAEWGVVRKYVEHYGLARPACADRPACQFTNANLHIELQEQGLFTEILTGLETVDLITCRDVADRVRHNFDIEHVIWWAVPVEAQTANWQPTAHYPTVYERMREGLDCDLAGRLFLIGAGAPGKCYAAWVKRAGGVALDIGSVFDGWAGVVSRSHLRGRQWAL